MSRDRSWLDPSGPAPPQGRVESSVQCATSGDASFECVRESPQACPGEELAGLTILLVEDEELVRSLFCRILEEKGYRVLACDDGGSAVLRAREYQGPIHLLVTDLNLPTLGGLEVARRVYALHPESKVLLVSGYAEDAELEDGEEFSTAETVHMRYPLLLKPFTAQTFLRRVEGILGRG